MSGSNETTPLTTPDWVQFYQHNVQPPHSIFNAAAPADPVSYATVVTTTATAAAATTSPTAPPSSSHGLSPDGGRVAKPAVRRRSRASRRTPTTVFNTDASNFRAMVQQFTGGGITGLTMLPPPPPLSSQFSISSGSGSGIGPQQVENLNIVHPRASLNMQFEGQSQQAYHRSDDHHHHLQAFLGRVSLHPTQSQGGSSSSSGNDHSRTETNYML